MVSGGTAGGTGPPPPQSGPLALIPPQPPASDLPGKTCILCIQIYITRLSILYSWYYTSLFNFAVMY